MILALDTREATCRMTLISDDGKKKDSKEWFADRQLARDLLSELEMFFSKNSNSLNDVKGLIIFKGPGSFTGLRIGITVMNTIAYSQTVPIVGETGEDWLDNGIERLLKGENDHIVMPDYGRDPRITTPRK